MRIDTFPESLTTQTTSQAPAATQKDQFLKLLVAQLQNQDPLKPQDGTEFVAQLAQFASLEQSAETNERLSSLQATQTSAARTALTGVVGQTVTARTESVVLGSGPPPTLVANLPAAATKIEAVIKDDSGREVRRIPLGASAAGDVPIVWDGKDANGSPLPPGSYHIAIEATGASGPVPASAAIQGRVTALEFTGGNPVYKIGSATVDPADIIRIGG